MTINDQFYIDLTTKLDTQAKLQFWVELAQKLIYPSLALGIVFMFWRTLKRTKVDELPIGVPVGGGNGNGQSFRPGSGSGVVTVEVLNQLIRENPANVTQAVRTWMTRDNAKPNN